MAKDVIKGMRERIAKSGANKKEIFYLPGDTKKRIRFLQELIRHIYSNFTATGHVA